MMSLSLGLALTQALAISAISPVRADEITMESKHTSSGVEGVTEKKGYAFKYGQRIKDWRAEIDKGTEKGWLTSEEAKKFGDRLDQLKTLNETVKGKGYPKSDLDDMEKQFNQYNIDLSHATSKATAAPKAETK
jgi:hypothetical protein